MSAGRCCCGGVMFGDGFAHTRVCPAYEGPQRSAEAEGQNSPDRADRRSTVRSPDLNEIAYHLTDALALRWNVDRCGTDQADDAACVRAFLESRLRKQGAA